MVSEKFYVGYSEINRNFELSNVGLLNYFQDIATIHGKQADDSLKTHDSCWFLTAYKVKIIKRPEYESFFNLSTWSKGVKGFTASREFEIKDDDGNLMVSAISNWIRVNKHTQKIERVTPELVEAYKLENHANFDYDWIPKLVECDKVDFKMNFVADRNYIDIHNHVNNVSYLKIANLVLPEDFFKSASESMEFEIMYRNAIKYGEKFVCLYTETDDFFNITMKNQDETELFAIVRLYKNK